MENKLPIRKRNRLEKYDYSSSGAYFITFCTKDRKCLLWRKTVGEDIILQNNYVPLSNCGEIVEKAIREIGNHYPNVELIKYVIMPNHVHLILLIHYGGRMVSSPTGEESECWRLINDGRMISSPTVSIIIGQVKRWVSRQVGFPLWQRSFYDHIIRNAEDYEECLRYIEENPIEWKFDRLYSQE